jgi:hypothetical protein
MKELKKKLTVPPTAYRARVSKRVGDMSLPDSTPQRNAAAILGIKLSHLASNTNVNIQMVSSFHASAHKLEERELRLMPGHPKSRDASDILL